MELAERSRQWREEARVLAEVFAGRAAQWDRTEQYPHENVRDLVRAGFMGMTIAAGYGGAGATLADAVAVIEEIARGCGVSGRIVVDGNLGALSIIMSAGPDWMKRRVASLVLAGDKPVIAISEPGAGTDVRAMTTTATVRGDQVVLNGTKTWITGAADSVVNVVVARLAAGGADQGLAAVYVERQTAGYELGARQYMMGLRGIPEMEVHFRNCAVPREHVIMRGLKNIMACYNCQRVGAAAVALGLAQAAFDDAIAYARSRRQFGQPIADFQGLRWKMVDARIALDASRLLIRRAATRTDPVTGLPDPELAAIAKIHAAEMAIQVTSQALQVHGAAGYSRSLRLERLFRDARMFTIGGGTTEALRNLCASYLFGLPEPRAGR